MRPWDCVCILRDLCPARTRMSESLERAIEWHRAGRLDDAALAYQRLIDADPGNHDAAYGLGTVRLQQGDAAAAAPLLRNAIGTYPDAPEYHFNYGCALDALDQRGTAAEAYLKAHEG